MKRYFTSLIILLFISIFHKLSGQQLHKDTAFLFKKANHSIFIDNSLTSKFYDRISDFRFGKFDKDNYDYSLKYLKDSGIKLTKYRIKDLPKKWIILKYFKDNNPTPDTTKKLQIYSAEKLSDSFKMTFRNRISFSFPQFPNAEITGISVLPKSVKLYSTFGGTTG